MMLRSLDWNALRARVSTGWILSNTRAKHPTVIPAQQSQLSDCVDHNLQAIAAGLTQCLIMDILNDVMQFGLECFLPARVLSAALNAYQHIR